MYYKQMLMQQVMLMHYLYCITADAQSSVAGDDEPPAASSDVKRENSVPEKDPSSVSQFHN